MNFTCYVICPDLYFYSFYIPQAAHGMVRPAFLGEQLQACELTPDRANVFVEQWTIHAKQIAETLRQQSLSEKQVSVLVSYFCIRDGGKLK